MIPTLVRWLVAALVGLFCRWLAAKVGGTCPLGPQTFVCGHWETLAGVAATILTALGYPVKRPGSAVATKREGLRIAPPPPPEDPAPAPSVLVDSQGAEIKAMGPDDPEWDEVHGGGG